VPQHLVGDGVAHQRDAEQVLLRVLAALADGLGDLVGLAQADAHMAVAITHHHQRGERETATALDHLGDAVDVHHPVLEVEIVRIDRSCHLGCFLSKD
jgi:hypothetical protein